MARTKVIVSSKLSSWEDVNEALRRIAEAKSAVDSKTAAYNEEEARQREELDKFCNPLRAEIAELEEEMKLYCEEHKDEFTKKKSREMANGSVGFRTGTPKLKTLRGFTWSSVLELLKRSVFKEQYLRTKEEINKEQVIIDFASKTVDNGALGQIGVEVTQDETFGYEVKVASNAAAVA